MVSEFIKEEETQQENKRNNIYANLLLNVWNKMYICMQMLGLEHFRKWDTSSTS